MEASELQRLLDDARSRHGVVGATLGVLKDGATEVAASGLLNVNTRVECTPDSVFQIGSISKSFTATLIMQLVDDGRLTLDDPVIDYLPDFMLADADAAHAITVRQLLNHTCGIDGDFFPNDDPEGPSAASYIRKMCLLPNIYPPGKGPMTYCNSGYVVAGRIIELLTGTTWQHAVMKRICEPLKMPAAFAHPEQALRFRCAMGHMPDPRDPNRPVLAEHTFLPISMAAAGSVLTMSADSLLLFAKAHMEDGACNGARLLSADSARKMRDQVIQVPPFAVPGVTHCGIGWFVAQGPNYQMVGHDGGTYGHRTYLRTFPENKLAFTVLANSLTSIKMFRELEKHLMESLLGLSIPPDQPAEPFHLHPDRYVGRYRNMNGTYTVTQEGGKLRFLASFNLRGIPKIHAALEPYRCDVFKLGGANVPAYEDKVVFVDSDEYGHAMYLRWAGRVALAESVSTPHPRACASDDRIPLEPL